MAIKSPEKKERIETRFGFVPSSRKKKKRKSYNWEKGGRGGKKEGKEILSYVGKSLFFRLRKDTLVN